MNKLVCITGLCGSGKSLVSDYLVNKKGYSFFRFGQITLDEVKKRGLPPSEELEKSIREEIRAKHGMAAFAILNLPKIEAFLKSGHVVGDGLYSFEEYKYLKSKFGPALKVIHVFAPPDLRYLRISNRRSGAGDTDLRHRPLTLKEAKNRDMSELEKLNKGATIAMADYTVLNTKDEKYLYSQLEEIISDIESKPLPDL